MKPHQKFMSRREFLGNLEMTAKGIELCTHQKLPPIADRVRKAVEKNMSLTSSSNEKVK